MAQIKNKSTPHARGLKGEALARLWLRLKGYTIVTSRWRSQMGEIDCIAQKHATLVFVEIKTRRAMDDAKSAISPHQQKRLIRAAHHFLSENQRYASFDLRFDAIFLAPWRFPCHIKNAWDG